MQHPTTAHPDIFTKASLTKHFLLYLILHTSKPMQLKKELQPYLITRVRTIEGAHNRLQAIAVGSPIFIGKLENLYP